jgi:hypothetical protein
MSFKIFSLQLLGKIKPVETVELKRKTLIDDYREFLQVESSDELKEYVLLDKEVNSAEFKKKKSEIEKLHFKGSTEHQLLKEFEGLQKKRSIRDYLVTAASTDLQKFLKLKAAEKTIEYFDLKKYIGESSFTKEKKDILGQVYRGSTEEKQLKDFLKLEKSNRIIAWVELQNQSRLKEEEGKKHSKKLRLYKETVNSPMLKNYLGLKEITGSAEFKKRVEYLKDKTKFEKSEPGKKLTRCQQLEHDTDIKFYLAFDKSKSYRNYFAVDGSAELKRYRELSEIIASSEFAERKKYLEDINKWEKTDEYKRQQKYIALKKQTNLLKYFKYKGTPVFDFYRNWEVAFADDFAGNTADTEKWSFTSFQANKMLGDNVSLAGDLHVFTQGKNLKTGKKLTIEVRKEKAAGKVWQMPAGFVPAEMEYTSGLVSTWNSFNLEDGIFEVKVKFDTVPQVVSSVYLSGETDLPRVNLVEMGTKNRMGVLTLNNKKAEVTGLDIANLKKGVWYIFTVEKQGSNLAWKINDTEVFQMQYPSLKGKLHLNIASLVVHEIPASHLPSAFEIEWVKCWHKK